MPSLISTVTDYRSSEDSSDISHPLEFRPPVKHDPIPVPYISPLVLRKELENLLDKEGDSCLNDPSFPDLHPIIFWNLLYLFHRIAVPSHLPGVLLSCPSLNSKEERRELPGWEDADYRNVRLVTQWDNVRLYTQDNIPLHIQWRKRNCAVSVHT